MMYFDFYPEWVQKAIIVLGLFGLACLMVGLVVGIVWVCSHLHWV